MIRITMTAFDGDDGTMTTAAGLTPSEAARHAWNLTNADIEDLSDAALLAVARIRPLRARSAPEPRMPVPGRAVWVQRRRA